MTDSTDLTLTTFVPGTKAKAAEVNANFTTLKTAISAKAALNGDSSETFSVADGTKDEHAINLSQLNDLSDDLTKEISKAGVKFCVHSGNTSNGKGSLFSYSVLRITPLIAGTYDNLVISNYLGNQTTISTTPSTLDLTGNSDGTYNIFINSSGELYILNNTIYRQQARPTMVVNDVWLDTSTEPFNCIKYSGSSDAEFLDVPLGTVTILSGAITAVETFPFNQNGYNINANTKNSAYKYDYANPVAKGTGVTYTAESNGLLFARHANTNDSVAVTIEGVYYLLGWSSSQGSGSSNFIPISKGQTYTFAGGELRYFIPEVAV